MAGPILFTHKGCFDGAVCAVLFRRHVEGGRVVFVGYEDVNQVVNEFLGRPDEQGTAIWIADMSVSEETAARLDARGNVTLLDHHKTARQLARHSWATIDEGRCGAKLLLEELSSPLLTVEYEDLVIRADDYDRWVHAYPDSRELARLCYILGQERFVSRFLNNPFIDLEPTEELLLTFDDERRRRTFERAAEQVRVQEDDAGHRYGLVFASEYVSELGEHLIQRFDLDYVVMLDPFRAAGSIRGRGAVDCSALAKARGGGGHPNAAGFPLDQGGLEAAMAYVWQMSGLA